MIEPKANGFGTEPPTAGGLRGMGCLALSDTDLMFVTWAPQKEFRIPRSAITSVDTSADDLAGVQKAMIMVTYTGDDGSEVTASWRLTDMVEWLTALGYDFGPDGPPADGRGRHRRRRRPATGRAQAIDAAPPGRLGRIEDAQPVGRRQLLVQDLRGLGPALRDGDAAQRCPPGRPGATAPSAAHDQARVGVEDRTVGVDGHAQRRPAGEGRGAERSPALGVQQRGREKVPSRSNWSIDPVERAGHHQALAVGGEGHRVGRAQPVGAGGDEQPGGHPADHGAGRRSGGRARRGRLVGNEPP